MCNQVVHNNNLLQIERTFFFSIFKSYYFTWREDVFFFKCDDGVFSALKEKGGVMERLDILTRCLRRQMGRAKKKFVHPVFTINGRLFFFSSSIMMS